MAEALETFVAIAAGAIVFEAGPTRWFGLAACAVLAGLAVRRAYNWQRASRGQESGVRSREPGARSREPGAELGTEC